MKHVENLTVKNNLCVSCGICKPVCPAKCIEYKRDRGQYVPVVDETKCIDCGICVDVCPGYSVDFPTLYSKLNQDEPSDIFTGNVSNCYSCHAKDDDVLANSVSGGAITVITKTLLDKRIYDCAFLVQSHNYENFIDTTKFAAGDDLTDTAKSRYVPISHENLITFMLKNKSTKVVIVATSCAIHGILKTINRFSLNRANYLILGLFCDRTLNYNFLDYFKDFTKKDAKIEKYYFRTKENCGWPGKIKIEFADGKSISLPSQERKVIKDYFEIERCIYCFDKLNQLADISIGDNYTGENAGSQGSNSIIVRSAIGTDVMSLVCDELNIFESNIEDIKSSQNIKGKQSNFKFAKALQKKLGIDLYPGDMDSNSITISESELKNSELARHAKIEKLNYGADYRKNIFHINLEIKKLKLKKYVMKLIKR